MADYEVVIIGGGPAGLTAGLYLGRSKHRTLLIEKENLGGNIKNVEWIENYPGFPEGVSGPQLASAMLAQATKYGLQVEHAEVSGIELYKDSRWVQCADGKGYTTDAVVVVGGSKYKKLGVPGEAEFQGNGVINCALCEGGQFADRVVAVCGGGDSGVTEALYLTKLASKVILVELQPSLTASAVLQERALTNPKLEICCGVKIEAIWGEGQVEAIDLLDERSGEKRTMRVNGILVAVGLDPNSGYLDGIVPLDSHGQIVVNDRMETEVKGLFAAGDIRQGSPRQVVTAVGDGAMAAISAERFLKGMR